MKHFYIPLLFISLASFSQTLECGVADVTEIGDEIQRRETLQQLRTLPNFADNPDGIAYVPVKVHLIGEDDDTGYLDSGTVNKALARLNGEFHAMDIQFYFSGTEFGKYPNSQLNGGTDFFDNIDFANTNGHDNAINIYFAKTVLVNGASVGGISPVSPTQQSLNRIFCRNASVANGKSFVHEFGHFFGLYHTFQNSTHPIIQNRELVTRDFDETPPRLSANCDLKGDFLCDTPADAYGNPDTDMNFCVYSGTLTDANGDAFSPDLANYMVYNTCVPYTFTAGQYARMLDGLEILNNPSNTFTLDAPETLQAAPTALTATADAYGVTLTWTDNSDVETGYLIERAASADGPFKVVAGCAENQTMLEHVPAVSGEPNFYRIKPSNSKNNYSAISGSVVSDFYCANYSAQSCTMPDPQIPALIVDDFSLVQNGVAILENLNSGCSVGGTADYYNAFSASASAGETLEFWAGSRAATTGGVFAVVVALYADWNQDYDFDDAGELVFESGPAALGVSGSFQIPSDIAAGDYRLRVVLTNVVNQPEPCYVFNGEMEDYKLVVTALDKAEFNLASVAIVPNPAESFIEIRSNVNPDRVVIADLTGKTVSDQIPNAGKADVSMLASGMYIVQVHAGSQTFRAKLVKE